jgi:hypothetical protein
MKELSFIKIIGRRYHSMLEEAEPIVPAKEKC